MYSHTPKPILQDFRPSISLCVLQIQSKISSSRKRAQVILHLFSISHTKKTLTHTLWFWWGRVYDEMKNELECGWDVLFYTFQFLKTMLLFVVIVLIGNWWSFFKPFLQENEKKVIIIVIPVTVLGNITSIVIRETMSFIHNWTAWNQLFLFVDLICCYVILLTIIWSISLSRETSKTNGKVDTN